MCKKWCFFVVSIALFASTASAFEMYNFDGNYADLLQRRQTEYRAYSTELTTIYKDSLSFFEQDGTEEEFKQVQALWKKYKAEACDAKRFFDGEAPSNDVMTQYLVAECNAWVTKARTLEIKFQTDANVELAFYKIASQLKGNEEQEFLPSWSNYVSANCQFSSFESPEDCHKRVNFYYKELEL